MRTHIRLARSSPGPVEADWKTDAYVAERRRRIRLLTSQLMKADDVTAESRAVGQSIGEAAATLIRDERSPRRHEKGAHTDTGDSVDRPDERVIWSPSRLHRRRRSGATPAAPALRSEPR